QPQSLCVKIEERPPACPVESHVCSYDELRPLTEEATASCGGVSRYLLSLTVFNITIKREAPRGKPVAGSESLYQTVSSCERESPPDKPVASPRVLMQAPQLSSKRGKTNEPITCSLPFASYGRFYSISNSYAAGSENAE